MTTRITAILTAAFAALLCLPTAAQLVTQMPKFRGGYLFAHMTKAEYGRLFYAVSEDGMHWRKLNDGKRILPDYRGHPDICRGHDDRYYLMGNTEKGPDVRIWVSDDLVEWEVLTTFLPDISSVPEFRPPGSWFGAPKLFYDRANRRYVITFHISTETRTDRPPWVHWGNMRTLYITTSDFETFTPAKRLLPFDFGQIDTIIRRDGNTYYAIIKDERYPDFNWPSGKAPRIASAPSIEGPWSDPGPRISPNFCEAPAVIQRADGMGWYLYCEMYDAFNYSLSTASTLNGPWHNVHRQLFSVPEGAKHGGMIAIPREHYDAILKAYGGGDTTE